MINNKKVLIFISIILCLSLCIVGCGSNNTSSVHKQKENKVVVEEEKQNLDNKEKENEIKEGKVEEAKQVKSKKEETKQVKNQATKQEKVSSENKVKSTGNEKSDKHIVNICIIGPENIGTILDSTEVEIEKNDTVLDILKKITKDKKIHMEYKGKKSTAYIEGIDNIYEFDKGQESGWMYSVNDVFPNKSAGIYTVEDGDVIKWLYTVELGKDLGVDINKLGEE